MKLPDLSFTADRLHVSLETDRVALVRTRGGLRPRIEAARLLATRLDPSEPEAGLEPLAAELATAAWQSATVQVVLSDRLVRYFIVDSLPGIQSLGELRRLAEAQFEELFGLPAAEWEICADFAPFSRRFLACALHRALLAALRRLFRRPGHALASIQPFLVREFNRRRRCLRSDPAWFAALERHSLTLALLSRKSWQGLRTHPFAQDAPALLPTLLARDRISHGESSEPSRLWLTGGAMAPEAMTSAGPLQISSVDSLAWPGRSGDWSRDYRLALAGIWP